MRTDHLIFLSIPGLRLGDVDKINTPTLYGWASAGAIAELTPTFPCVTSPVQATMLTGSTPAAHGVIANGFYDRDRREVKFWVAHNDVIAGDQVWETIRKKSPKLRSAVWHAQNIKGAAADFIITPAPIHEPDGTPAEGGTPAAGGTPAVSGTPAAGGTAAAGGAPAAGGTPRLWCYSKPEGMYQELLDTLGHFPLQHYWGPMANIESTRWILDAALWLIRKHAPNYHWIYIPHLDYAAQKHGPNSPEAKRALRELDQRLGEFADHIAESPIGDHVVYLVAGEYALTDVVGAVYPNRNLREAGLLAVRQEAGAEYLDPAASKAFAMVDHQLAHVYVEPADPRIIGQVREMFLSVPGVAGVYAGHDRARIGLDHQRSGDLVLVTDDAHWFAYYWWLADTAAPPFARTVDIHRKPGYDPVELFLDPGTKGIPLDAELVKGSHGVPATAAKHRTALICSAPASPVRTGRTYRDLQIKQITLELLK